MDRLSEDVEFEEIIDETERLFHEEKPIKVSSVPKKDTENLSESVVIESLIKSYGNRTNAAKSLGVSRSSLTKFIESHPTVEETYFNIGQSLVDNCETLIQSIAFGQRGKDGGWIEKPDLKAIMFILERMGADRGWAKASGPGTQVNVQNNQVVVNDSKEKFIRIGDTDYGI